MLSGILSRSTRFIQFGPFRGDILHFNSMISRTKTSLCMVDTLVILVLGIESRLNNEYDVHLTEQIVILEKKH